MSPARHRNDGWVPQQHGAWAMLVVPILVGGIWRIRDGGMDLRDWLLLPALAVAWILGYFAFNAATLWLKARPARRAGFTRPLLVYSSVAGSAALLAVILQPRLLTWAPVYAALTAGTCWLVTRGRERAVLSGLLTIAAASAMATTMRSAVPFDADIGQWEPALVCFVYFFGTVLYVKTLIRERGKPGWVAVSTGYHACAAATAVVLAGTGGIGGRWTGADWAVWAVFAAALTIRAAGVPLLGPMRGRTVTPKQAGIGEAVLSTVLAVLLLAL